jgi:hypothetical protein
VHVTELGLCSIVDTVDSVETLGLVPGRLLERLLLGKQVVRMGAEWNWLRIVSNGRICNTTVEIWCLATTG